MSSSDTQTTPYLLESGAVVTAQGTDADAGLTAAEAGARLQRFGPNEITAEPPPSLLQVAAGQFQNPMNLMLVAVTVASFLIGEISTGIIVALLILLNVVLVLIDLLEVVARRHHDARWSRGAIG